MSCQIWGLTAQRRLVLVPGCMGKGSGVRERILNCSVDREPSVSPLCGAWLSLESLTMSNCEELL